jgi:hypothetical protein
MLHLVSPRHAEEATLTGSQIAKAGTVASSPKVPPAGSKVEPLPVQTAARSPQSNQSWHRRWRSGTLVEDVGLSGRQMQQCLPLRVRRTGGARWLRSLLRKPGKAPGDIQ